MNISALLVVSASLACAGQVQAQQFEIVHGVDYQSTSGAQAALDALFADKAMEGAKATLYASDLGAAETSHLVVVDFDNYDDYVTRNRRRMDSHGWSKYLLATQDANYHSSDMFVVVDDHGDARHSAGYLAAYLVNSSDAELYREAVSDLNEAIGNPGVLRLVARRTGARDFTHAVLIGGKDFATVNKYLDKLQGSDAYTRFIEKVGDTRELLGLYTYRRVAHWGY